MDRESILLGRLKNIYLQITTHANVIEEYLQSLAIAKTDDVLKQAASDIEKIHEAVSILNTQSEQLKKIDVNAVNFSKQLITLRHDLRSAVNAIKGYSEVVLEIMEEFHQTNFAGIFRAIIAIVLQVLHTIDEIRELPQVGADIVADATVLRDIKIPVYTTTDKVIEAVDYGIVKETTKASPKKKETISPFSVKYAPEFGKQWLEKEEKKKNLVLVVDDLVTNRDLISDWLMLKHYRVITAKDGYEALKILDQHDNIDVILLDVMMPGMDGYEVLQHIKSSKKYSDTPVIMISAMDEMDTIVRCIKLGAEDYLTKPFNPFLLGARISSCIEKKQLHDIEKAYMARIEEEMSIAQHIQLSMLPTQFPESSNFSIYGKSIPAKEVGGDFYDFYLFPEGKIGFVIGDVSGKGIPAALFMAVSRTVLYSLATLSNTPGQYIEYANKLLQKENEALMFVTLFYGVLDQTTGHLAYINCGHFLPITLRATGKVDLLGESDGSALGVIKDLQFRQHTAMMNPGDLILLYTDGITDAMNKEGEEYGSGRLLKRVKTEKHYDPKSMIDDIANDVNKYVEGQEQYDDITALALLFKSYYKKQ